MEPAFWLDRWEQNLIGFHQQQINPYLQQHWHRLALAPGAGVLVPLCGKSRDMRWLAEQGYRVLGVELSERAVRDFFRERGQPPQVSTEGAFSAYRVDMTTLLCGDFFALEKAQLEKIAAVYDRASLIALPPPMRQAYARQLGMLLPAGVVMLLVGLEYPQEQMNGPPFAVPEAEVNALFATHWSVELLQADDVLAAEPRFRERGLTRLVEKTYLLRRRSS